MNKRLIFICFVVIGMTVQAQTDGFSVNLGLTLPTNIGTSADSDDPVGMGTGFSAGIRLQYALNVKNLHYFADVDIRHNGLSSDGKSLLNKSKRMLDEAWGYDRDEASSSIKGSSYWYIPLVTGLNYSYPLGESLALWGEVGTGFVYQIITDQTYQGHYYYTQSGTAGGYHYTNTYEKSTKMVTSFDNAIHWAMHLGVGVSLNSHLSLGINYDWFFGQTTMRSEYTTTLEKDYSSGAGHNHTSSTDHPDPTVVKGDAASSAMFSLNIGYSF